MDRNDDTSTGRKDGVKCMERIRDFVREV